MSLAAFVEMHCIWTFDVTWTLCTQNVKNYRMIFQQLILELNQGTSYKNVIVSIISKLFIYLLVHLLKRKYYPFSTNTRKVKIANYEWYVKPLMITALKVANTM